MFLTGPAGSGKRTSVMRVLFRTQTMRVNLKEAKLSKSFLRTLGIGRATALVAKYGKPSFFTTMTMDGAHSEDVGAREEMPLNWITGTDPTVLYYTKTQSYRRFRSLGGVDQSGGRTPNWLVGNLCP